MNLSLESKIAALESENESLRSRPPVVVTQPVVTNESIQVIDDSIQQQPVMKVYNLYKKKIKKKLEA